MDDSNPKEKRKNMPRGIFLLPNLFTTGALFAGFYAIIAAMNGRFEIAATSIFIAFLLDGLDGRVARLTNTQSAFGAEYDSLSDMVSFGVAPALVVYMWSLVYLRDVSNFMGKVGWMVAFIYVTATALRASPTWKPSSALSRGTSGLSQRAGSFKQCDRMRARRWSSRKTCSSRQSCRRRSCASSAMKR